MIAAVLKFAAAVIFILIGTFVTLLTVGFIIALIIASVNALIHQLTRLKENRHARHCS